MKPIKHFLTLFGVLFIFSACTYVERELIDNIIDSSKPGVYGTLPALVEEGAEATKATLNPTTLGYQFEVGDKLNIWDSQDGYMIFKASTGGGNNAAFDFEGGGFPLQDGETYHSSIPLVRDINDEKDCMTIVYEGQQQTGNEVASHMAKFAYFYASATCTNGRTSFAYNYANSYVRLIITLPETNMTLTEVSIEADSDMFALEGKLDVTTGVFTPAADKMSNTMTLSLNNVEVTDGVLKAFVSTAPQAAGSFIIHVKDAAGKVYSSAPITKSGALAAGKIRRFETTVAEDNAYDLITADDLLEDGNYVLAYYDASAGGYKLFSFENTMANAEAAAALVENVHGLSNLLANGSAVYRKFIEGNYVTVAGAAGAETIYLSDADEAAAKLSLTGNSTSAKITLTSGAYTLRLDKIMTTINSDYTATISVQPNAPDAINIMNSLRGGTITITFNDLMDFAVAEAEKEGITFTADQIDRLHSGFVHLCTLAKELIKDKLGKDLMDITLTTNVFDVISQYYDNVAEYSLQISQDKKFGWFTPVGFYVGDDGFTANMPLPNYGWFDRLDASLEGDKDACVAYWAQYDDDYNYNILGITQFFSRLARRAVNELDDSTYAMLQQIDFSAIGQVYKRYAERVNDPLASVYIYKKVE